MTTEQKIEKLSHEIWEAYVEKNMEKIKSTAYDKCLYVHMGVTLDLAGEVGAIETSRIVYSNVDFEDTVVRMFGNTAIVTNKLKLTAIVEGNEVVNPFVVTEVFVEEDTWKLASLAYTRIVY